MPCSIKAVLASLYYVSCTLKFLFVFFYLFSLFIVQLFASIFRTEDENEEEMSYEEDEEEEEQEDYGLEDEDEKVETDGEDDVYSYLQVETNHLVADIVNGGEGLMFVAENSYQADQQSPDHAHSHSYESIFEDLEEEDAFDAQVSQNRDSPSYAFDHNENENDNGIIDHEVNREDYVTAISNPEDYVAAISNQEEVSELIENEIDDTNAENHVAEQRDVMKMEDLKEESNFTKDEKFIDFRPPKSEAKKLQVLNEENDDEMFSDAYTVGSTSKNSSDWRSSIRDSGTEDMSSSSSRRSCRKWESYTLYQKYDEEMMFLDRISAQKLHETESLRSIKVEPRSISHRIAHKLANKNKPTDRVYLNTYRELEAAYVAQICITWEALNWNYANFQRKRASSKGLDIGCPAYIAQQFQQFQVLLQRYVENEPYEQGRRPEIYARMRSIAPKLLQVPEYQDYDDEQKDEPIKSRISSETFLTILEDDIQTYMKFLKADKERRCQVIAALFRGREKGSIDPALIRIFKKIYKKKKLELKNLQQQPCNNCFKISNLPKDKNMEITMSLIDLKVVSRVLRMKHVTKEQLQWSEGKMGKIKVSQKKLQRDPSPLFFPSH